MKNKTIKIIAIICIVIVVLFPVGVFLITNEVVIVWFASLFSKKLKNGEYLFTNNGVYTYVVEEEQEDIGISKIVTRIYKNEEDNKNNFFDSNNNKYAIDFTFYDNSDSLFDVSFEEFARKRYVSLKSEGIYCYNYVFSFAKDNKEHNFYIRPMGEEKIMMKVTLPVSLTPKILNKDI